MTIEEYRNQSLAILKLPDSECWQKLLELEMEYLAEQAVPDAERAAELILEAQNRGELPELENASQAWTCELLDLSDDDNPDFRFWRCTDGNFTIDVSADDGEVNFIWG